LSFQNIYSIGAPKTGEKELVDLQSMTGSYIGECSSSFTVFHEDAIALGMLQSHFLFSGRTNLLISNEDNNNQVSAEN